MFNFCKNGINKVKQILVEDQQK